jgi:hypothetical protein
MTLAEWAKVSIGFTGLILFAALVVDFHKFLEHKHYEAQPLQEIRVYPRTRRTDQQIEIDKCPWDQFGELNKAIECRERVINRTDI